MGGEIGDGLRRGAFNPAPLVRLDQRLDHHLVARGSRRRFLVEPSQPPAVTRGQAIYGDSTRDGIEGAERFILLVVTACIYKEKWLRGPEATYTNTVPLNARSPEIDPNQG